jgi:hypothetical protein
LILTFSLNKNLIPTVLSGALFGQYQRYSYYLY